MRKFYIGPTGDVEALPGTGKWAIQSETSPIDDSPSVFLNLKSSDNVIGKYSRSGKATLTIRCFEGKTAIYFNMADNFLADSAGFGDVTYRIDDRPAVVREFDESTDHMALGLWSGGKSIPVVKSLLKAQSLIVRITPYSESPQMATFDIRGLDVASATLRKACKW